MRNAFFILGLVLILGVAGTVDRAWFLRYSTWELQKKVGIAYVVS